MHNDSTSTPTRNRALALAALYPTLLLPNGPAAGTFAREVWDGLSPDERAALATVTEAEALAGRDRIEATVANSFPAGI